MIVQVDPNTLVNTDHIECIRKLGDNKVVIYLSSGDTVRLDTSITRLMDILSPLTPTTKLLNETCA
jgi:hypothetical protein